MIEPLLGTMPEYWEETTLGEICRRGGGGIQTGPFGSQLHAFDYVPDGIPSIMPVNIGENRILRDGIACITEEDAERLSQHRVKAGDIIYSPRGDVERRALIRENEAGWLCGTGCLKVRLGAGVVDPLFASYQLGHPAVRQWIVRHAVGATMPNLNTGIMNAVPFALPPLPEQKAIARILGTLDDKIELNRRMNATLEAMARALFQSWFIDFDPVHRNAARNGRKSVHERRREGLPKGKVKSENSDPTASSHLSLPTSHFDFDSLFSATFQDSELGEIPAGWAIKGLDQIAQYLNGLALQKFPAGEGETLPVIKIAQLRKDDTVWADRCNAELPQEYVVNDGDVLFSWSGSLEVELWCGGLGALNQHLFKVTSHEFPQWFYYHWTRHHLDNFRLIAASKATTMGHIQRKHLTEAKVLVPPASLIDALTPSFQPLLDQIVTNRTQSRTLAALRNTLLPKLLRGKMSVAVAEEVVHCPEKQPV